MTGILGRKLGMTRVIQDDGRVIPMTVIQCEPNTITQIKTVEKDGYPAIVLGFDALKNPSKNHKYHFSREFRIKGDESLEKGTQITVEIFKEGEEVIITGTSKGKGFQGVVKRWHMAGGPASHGSHFHREPGSVGARAKPGKILRGKHLPGHMGNQTKTIKSSVVFLDQKKNLIGIKGAVPGSINTMITLRKLA
ncbi:MAG: 50S ribosomal protein L3 [Candidatus Gracilibacteria bacterium]|jgi:large subunit ribosomal protein L3